MNIILKAVSASLPLVLLTGCGDENHHAHEEHGHGLFISQANNPTLSFLEEGQLESLHDSAADNGAELLLASNGEAAAIITASQVQFISAHEEEEAAHAEAEHDLPELSVTDVTGANIQVVNSNGHFSVLVDGSTHFIAYEGLTSESIDLLAVESYPALMMNEASEHVLGFVGMDASIYQAGGVQDSIACEVVNSVAQSAEFAVVSCDGNTQFSAKVTESFVGQTPVYSSVIKDLNESAENINTSVQWKTAAGVFVGLGADDRFYVLEEDTVTESLALEIDFAAPNADMCDWGVDSAAADIFVLTPNELFVYAHDGSSHSVVLDNSQQADCGDLRMATAAQAVAVIDNQAQYLYEIDKEDRAVLYHIHGRENLSVNDVESVLMFHEMGETGGHAH